MKLLEFRVASESTDLAERIGDLVAALFLTDIEYGVVVFFSARDKKPFKLLDDIDVVKTLAKRAYRRSYSRISHPDDIFAIRSVASCKFVVFEESGLLRMCLKSEDSFDMSKFGNFQGVDVSNLLIDTDLFDSFYS